MGTPTSVPTSPGHPTDGPPSLCTAELGLKGLHTDFPSLPSFWERSSRPPPPGLWPLLHTEGISSNLSLWTQAAPFPSAHGKTGPFWPKVGGLGILGKQPAEASFTYVFRKSEEETNNNT